MKAAMKCGRVAMMQNLVLCGEGIRCPKRPSRTWIAWLVRSATGSTYNKKVKDNMNRIISLALLVIGIVLIVFGVLAMDSFSSDVSRFFTGAPTDKAVWMLIGGVITTLVGLSGVAFLRPGNKG